jgi:hypothetical protein
MELRELKKYKITQFFVFPLAQCQTHTHKHKEQSGNPQTLLEPKRMIKLANTGRKHMMGGLIHFSMLTVQQNMDSTNKTIEGLKHHGMPPPELYLNTPVQNPKSINDVHRNILEAHFEIIQRFVDTTLAQDPGAHLMVAEDDAEAVRPQPVDLILDAVRYLEAERRSWVILYLGVVPMGPSLYIGKGLVNVSAPYSAHAYVINGRQARSIVALGKGVCRRPIFVEGGSMFPFFSKFAFFNPVFSQSRLPKEMHAVSFLRNHVSFEFAMVSCMWLSLMMPLLLTLLFVVLLKLCWRRVLRSRCESACAKL